MSDKNTFNKSSNNHSNKNKKSMTVKSSFFHHQISHQFKNQLILLIIEQKNQ